MFFLSDAFFKMELLTGFVPDSNHENSNLFHSHVLQIQFLDLHAILKVNMKSLNINCGALSK